MRRPLAVDRYSVERVSGSEPSPKLVIARPSLSVRIAFDLLGAAVLGGIVEAIASNGDFVPVIGVVLVVAGLVGLNRVKVAISGDQLIACNGFRTHHWTRDEVDRFVFSSQGIIGGWVEAVLASGTAQTLSATKVVCGRREAEAVRDNLNEWLKPEP